MKWASTIVVSSLMVATAPSFALAESQARFGVTMGYPAAVGVLWNATNRVAVRPEATWSKGSSDSSSSNPFGQSDSALPSDNWEVGAGLSALFYLSSHDGLRAYVSPRFAYLQSNTSAALTGTATSTTSDLWSYTTSGSFGAQYSLGRHFALFGELGVSYTSTTSRQSTVETVTVAPAGAAGALPSSFTVRSDTHAHTVGTRSGVGVIFFF